MYYLYLTGALMGFSSLAVMANSLTLHAQKSTEHNEGEFEADLIYKRKTESQAGIVGKTLRNSSLLRIPHRAGQRIIS